MHLLKLDDKVVPHEVVIHDTRAFVARDDAAETVTVCLHRLSQKVLFGSRVCCCDLRGRLFIQAC